SRHARLVMYGGIFASVGAYLGVTGRLEHAFMKELEQQAVGTKKPDIPVILDVDPEEGMRRAAARRGGESADRYEKEALDIHRRRRAAFLDIARAEPGRCVVIDATRPHAVVEKAILDAAEALVARRNA